MPEEKFALTVPFTGDEKTSLHVALQRHRDAVVWKLDGVSEADARRPMVPSGTSLLGLVKHLASVEYGWFCSTFGRETEPLPDVAANPGADMRAAEGESTGDILAFYERACAAADAVIDAVGLEETGTTWDGRTMTMRWVLIHMLEETARHAGHADILRELIDGRTGDHKRG
jgi:uncharacterized damage-inducible protein DinB